MPTPPPTSNTTPDSSAMRAGEGVESCAKQFPPLAELAIRSPYHASISCWRSFHRFSLTSSRWDGSRSKYSLLHWGKCLAHEKHEIKSEKNVSSPLHTGHPSNCCTASKRSVAIKPPPSSPTRRSSPSRL